MLRKKFLEIVEKLRWLNCQFARLLESIGGLSLLLIMVVTTVDVIGAKVFRVPVPGALDIVMLAQSVAISFGCAATLIAGKHVSVEIFYRFMPPILKKLSLFVVETLSLLLFVLIVWKLTIYGYELQIHHEGSPTIRIPLYPFAYGIVLASVSVCIELFGRIVKILIGGKYSYASY